MKRLVLTVVAGMVALTGCGKFFSDTTNPVTPPSNTVAGNVLYVPNINSAKLAAYTVSTAGALSVLSGFPFAPPQPPISIAITPGNTYLYVGVASGILGYAIGTSGALTELNSGSSLTDGDVPAPLSMQVDATGNYLLAAGINLGSGSNTPQVGVYAIDTATGALTAQSGSPLAVGNGNGSGSAAPVQLYLAPNNQFAFLTLGPGGTELLNFSESSGGLSDAGSFIPLTSKGTQHNYVVANGTSTLLFLPETGAGVRVFTMAASGALSEISGSPFAAGTGPGGIAIDSTGDYLYVANKGSGSISGFTVGASGTLTAMASSPFATGTLPVFLTFDQSKKFLAVANEGSGPDVGMYSLDTTTPGKLDPLAGAAFAIGVSTIAATH